MKSRWAFFFGHLAISAFLALLVYLLVFHLWYPDPLAKTLDVGPIFWMMIGIDVVLGPLLTLVVYKKNWRELRWDLTLIGLVQLSALGYAVYSMDAARPAWVAFEKDRFILVTKNEILEDEKQAIPTAFASPPLLGVGYANTNSDKVTDKSNLLFQEIFGVKASQYPYMYEALEKATPQIRAKAQPVDELKKFNKAEVVQNMLAKHPQADTFLPLLTTKNQELTMLLNSKANNPIVKIVDLKPWE